MSRASASAQDDAARCQRIELKMLQANVGEAGQHRQVTGSRGFAPHCTTMQRPGVPPMRRESSRPTWANRQTRIDDRFGMIRTLWRTETNAGQRSEEGS